jgi:hypothetical protein
MNRLACRSEPNNNPAAVQPALIEFGGFGALDPHNNEALPPKADSADSREAIARRKRGCTALHYGGESQLD